ncbi:MAG TPA: ParA family protein [Chloroflexota bacterium]|nr:ParA family protein [Chloroflexota bacterium]
MSTVPTEPTDPAPPRVLAITNQKGGVGKTTTAINLAAALADFGHPTLLIDLDPQAHATIGLGIDPAALPHTMSHVLTADTPLADVLQPTSAPNLQIAPAHMDLAFAEESLSKAVGRDVRLKKRLEELGPRFEYVVIDSPAQLNLLTINTMAAATEVVVPLHSQYYSFVGLAQLLETIRMMQSWVNPALVIAGALVTQFDKRSALHRRALERLRTELDGQLRVFHTVIPHGLRAQYAAEYHSPVVRLFPRSPVGRAYKELAAEVAHVQPA